MFNGKKLSQKLGHELKKHVSRLDKTPKLVSIVIGNDSRSLFYQKLKKKRAGEIGIEVVVKEFPSDTKLDDIVKFIKILNQDDSVGGIMLQIPLPSSYSVDDRNKIIDEIDAGKDVDGMREDSDFNAPVVRAVMLALEEAEKIVQLPSKKAPCKVTVLGHTGFEGRLIYRKLESQKKLFDSKVELMGVDKRTKNKKKILKTADVIISATGVPGLIQPETIKENVVLIDVGAPKGDVDKSTYDKASFVSPVPGGIGPLTIYYLLENVVDAAI